MKTAYDWKRTHRRKEFKIGDLLEATVYRTQDEYFEATVSAISNSDYQEFPTEDEAIAWCETEITGHLERADLIFGDPGDQ